MHEKCNGGRIARKSDSPPDASSTEGRRGRETRHHLLRRRLAVVADDLDLGGAGARDRDLLAELAETTRLVDLHGGEHVDREARLLVGDRHERQEVERHALLGEHLVDRSQELLLELGLREVDDVLLAEERRRRLADALVDHGVLRRLVHPRGVRVVVAVGVGATEVLRLAEESDAVDDRVVVRHLDLRQDTVLERGLEAGLTLQRVVRQGDRVLTAVNARGDHVARLEQGPRDPAVGGAERLLVAVGAATAGQEEQDQEHGSELAEHGSLRPGRRGRG